MLGPVAQMIAPGVFLPRPDGTASFDNLAAGTWSLWFAGLRPRQGVPPDAVLVHQDGRAFLLDDDFENGFVLKLQVAAASTARVRLQGTFAPETMQPGKCC
jgi:hypothetical protein